MTKEEAKGMIAAKLRCMELEDLACIEKGCDRDCDNCQYMYSQGTHGEHKEAMRIAIEALEKVGLNPERGYTEVNFDDYDGLLIPGGPDIDPYFYGEENYASKNTDFDFDRETLKCIDHFVNSNKPIVGICLGQQFLNVYFKAPNPTHRKA